MIGLQITDKREKEAICGGNHQQGYMNLVTLTDQYIRRPALLIRKVDINIQ